MPLRPIGLRRPPTTGSRALDSYLQNIREALAGLPFSYFSTADGPNSSGVTAPRGTIGIEIGTSSTTDVWFKAEDSSATTGWEAFNFSNAHAALHKLYDTSVITQSGVSTLFQQYTGFDAEGISSKISSSVTDADMAVRRTGIYNVSFDISMTGTNNTRYDFELHRNATDMHYGFTLDTGSAGDVANGTFHSIITANSGDTLAVHVKSNNASGADVETYTANFTVEEIDSA